MSETPSDLERLELAASTQRARVRDRARKLETEVGRTAEDVADSARAVRSFPHEHAWWLVAGATTAGFLLGRRAPSRERSGLGLGGLFLGAVVRAAATRVVTRAFDRLDSEHHETPPPALPAPDDGES